MKRLTVLILCLAAIPAMAQHNTRQEVFDDIERAGGVYYMYPMNQPKPTVAPKGYKPFYIRHVGRHGARYALGDTVYEDLMAVWQKAHEGGLLTPAGEEFYNEYASIYPELTRREGLLTHKGQDQHRYIARNMYENYPEVFKGQTMVRAYSTVSHRVIVSMFSFLSELENLDATLDFDADYGYPYQAFLLPEVIDSGEDRDAGLEDFERFKNENLNLDAITGRWFTNPDAVLEDKYKFCFDLHTLVSTLDNIDIPAPQGLYGLFTPQERYSLWRVSNFRDYQIVGWYSKVQNLRPKAMKNLLADIIDNAETDWQKGISLRLRFAHDSSLMPLLSLMNVNGWGIVTDNPEEVEKYWRSFDIPMATNFQLIFFKSKKNPDVLVQVLHNGFEATLPFPMAAPGSFYRWEDIKAYYSKLL